MFDTCTHKCGYCWLAESGQVLDAKQLEPFRDPSFIDRVAAFFNSRTTPERRWLVQFTGGEPLLAPNLPRLCTALFEHGNAVSFYTSLFIGENHPSFRFLLEHPYPEVDYLMASFHPEAEADEDRHIAKFARLREAGHRVYFRYIGHPKRLDKLEHFEERCRELDISFYPTTLLSNSHPNAYTDEERERLASFFTTKSQYVQLAGGVDTTDAHCWAGSRNIAVNLQTGAVTPCITVDRPILGNLFEDKLREPRGAIRCPQAGISCVCDVHYQQDIVIGGEDSEAFERAGSGFVDRKVFGAPYAESIARLEEAGLRFYEGTHMGVGDVAEDRLFFTREEVKQRWRARGAASARNHVSVEVAFGEDLLVGVKADNDLETVEAFVHEASDGSTDGEWVQLGAEPVEGRETQVRFDVDQAQFAPGIHRIAVNVFFTDGKRLYWYEQEPRSIELHGDVGTGLFRRLSQSLRSRGRRPVGAGR